MEYKLCNENYKSDYVKQLVASWGADADILRDPPSSVLQSPLDLENIREGAHLLKQVLQKNGHIVVICDCDVDGMTSASVIWMYIKRLYPEARLDFKIHTAKQHGLSDLIDGLIEESEDIDLIVVPDAGSNDEEQHTVLHDCGVPVLCLDHHEVDVQSKNAIIINNQSSPNYKNKQLTGAGVVYQFCRYLDSLYGVNYADDYIDLVALGLISDMAQMVEPEIAYLVKQGLEKPIKNFLFQSFLDKQSYSIGARMNYISIAFYVTPLINALIRVGTMEEKENLFLAFIDGEKIVPSTKRGEKGMSEKLATQVVRNCVNARARQNKELECALEQIDFRIQDQELDKHNLLVVELNDEDCLNPTLNGLLAMKCAARYQKPTLVLRENDEGYSRGSARGINNSKLEDLKGYLTELGLFEYCQGHSQAFGSSIKHNLIPDLLARADKDLAQYNFGTTYYKVNFERKAFDSDIEDIIYDIDKYHSIYGQGCQEPIIAITNIDVEKKDIQIMGKNKDTVKIIQNGIAYMFFRAGALIEQIEGLSSMRLEVVGRANVNEWGGQYTPQIFVDDYNVYDNRLIF